MTDPAGVTTTTASGTYVETIQTEISSAPQRSVSFRTRTAAGASLGSIEPYTSNVQILTTTGPDVPGVNPDIGIGRFLFDANACSWADLTGAADLSGAAYECPNLRSGSGWTTPSPLYGNGEYVLLASETATTAAYASAPGQFPSTEVTSTVAGATVTLGYSGETQVGSTAWYTTCAGSTDLSAPPIGVTCIAKTYVYGQLCTYTAAVEENVHFWLGSSLVGGYPGLYTDSNGISAIQAGAPFQATDATQTVYRGYASGAVDLTDYGTALRSGNVITSFHIDKSFGGNPEVGTGCNIPRHAVKCSGGGTTLGRP